MQCCLQKLLLQQLATKFFQSWENAEFLTSQLTTTTLHNLPCTLHTESSQKKATAIVHNLPCTLHTESSQKKATAIVHNLPCTLHTESSQKKATAIVHNLPCTLHTESSQKKATCSYCAQLTLHSPHRIKSEESYL